VARTCRGAGFEPRIAFLASDPLAIRAVIASGLAVTLTSRLLAGQLHGVRIAAVRGEPARRALYALLPDSGARPLDRAMLSATRQAFAMIVTAGLTEPLVGSSDPSAT
jgi:DNA-binding transcriptional LysR family regulator